MAIGPRLDLRQTQSLVMTPQLQQAIRLLALSNLEIEGFIAGELEKNPLLETESETSSEETDATPDPDSGEPEFDADNENLNQDSAADRLGVSSDRGASSGDSAGLSGEAGDIEALASSDVSLHEHLLAQAGAVLSGADFFIAGQIIAQIDETGYLTTPLVDIARRLGVAEADAAQVLAAIQQFDPTGVGARSLAECLALQAIEADRHDPAMARLIENLDYLAKGNLNALKRICQVDDEDLADMIGELRAYDPKPGCRYAQGSRVQVAVPDVFVARKGNGWVIELNGATLPRLLVNRAYHAELAAASRTREAKAWLSECLAGAGWLIKALDQRARTIMKVASEIVKRQEGFFLHGVEALKPLTLRAVAEAIGMHESTVSRVTSNKYLACERGLFELKYFFSSAIQGADGGEAASALAVKEAIRALIAAEGHDILSDDQLVALLRVKGFDIARRTVAKYREAIGLGSSVQRRRRLALGPH